MASMKHEGLVSLFRNYPARVPELLQGSLGVELPAWSELRVESPDFTQVVPTEYRADMVVLLKRRRPVLAGWWRCSCLAPLARGGVGQCI
jgi:hypothetical protein